MAVAAGTAAAFLTKFSERPRVRIDPVCCLPARFELTRRKNHLRPKILKTMRQRFPPEESPISLVGDLLDDSVTRAPLDVASATEGMSGGGGGAVGDESLQSVGVVRDEGGVLGDIMAMDVVKFGFWFVGLFVLQTVCSVWVMGRSRRKDGSDDENLKEVNKNVDGREKVDVSMLYGNGGLSKAGSVVRVDVEKRIDEIRLMAREARMIEKQGSQDGGDESEGDEDEESSGGRTDIEKEIDARLEKLRRQFKSAQKSVSPASNGSGRVGGVNGVDSSLMFERKLKFRSPSPVGESSQPKGFNGGEFRGKAEKKKRSGATITNTIGKNGRKTELEKIVSRHENAGGGEMISFGQVKREDGDAGGKSGENLRKSSQVTAKISGVQPSIATDIPGSKSNWMTAAKKFEGNQLVDADDRWWLSLPCVFAILMKRGPDTENPGGLFTLKIFSQEDSEDDTDDDDDDEGLSYVIAFEHRTDASNFCFLLDSFFEDLGDFGADIVPLLKKDLLEMVQEQEMKIFVLRKGQLPLYAGQPFREVELTLKSMIQGNQRR